MPIPCRWALHTDGTPYAAMMHAAGDARAYGKNLVSQAAMDELRAAGVPMGAPVEPGAYCILDFRGIEDELAEGVRSFRCPCELMRYTFLEEETGYALDATVHER